MALKRGDMVKVARLNPSKTYTIKNCFVNHHPVTKEKIKGFELYEVKGYYMTVEKRIPHHE